MGVTKTIYPGSTQVQSNPVPNQTFSQVPPQNPKATIFPGAAQAAQVSGGIQNIEHKPIMGFLYSVSRTEIGEYWPLYLGPNNIGRGANSDICLSETSVSDSHAVVVVRRMLRQGEKSGLFVFVQDTGSTCGTMLNGDTLDFNPRECHSGDIITIGENYELYLVLIDPDAVGLAPKENFKAVAAAAPVAMPVQTVAPQPAAPAVPPMGMNTGGMPKGTMVNVESPFANATNAGAPSANPFSSSKATIYMPKK